MAKYLVTVTTLFVDGVKHKRGDIIETDKDFGTNVQPYVEVAPVVEEKPKPVRKTRTVKAKASVEG